MVALPLALIFALDLAWGSLGVSSGSVFFAVVDEPAHLATCALALAALLAVRRGPASPKFLLAALFASVVIDFDHLPGLVGWGVFTAGTPRPYSHSLLTIAALLLAAALCGRRPRPILLGAGFGVAAHLLRDLATGPGVPLWLPFSTDPVRIAYAVYAGLLLLGAAIALRPLSGSNRQPSRDRRSSRSRVRVGRALGPLLALTLLGGLVLSPGGAVAADGGGKDHHKGAGHRRAKVAMGIYVPGGDRDPSLLAPYADATGEEPAIVQGYRTWQELPFEESSLRAITSVGALPLITWEPWDREEDGYSLAAIAAGAFDGYIAEAARQARSWGGVIFVRFAHEMNGNWYPWGDWDPATYKAAWRHVVSIFRAEGATNVRWVWTPYVEGSQYPFRRYYPGDRWVDWAGLDGFNWGKPFASFAKIFDDSYRRVVKMTEKPLMIAETGSVEGSGNAKAIWIRRALRRALPRLAHIRALIWWSDVHPDGTDWRIDTSASALQAFGTSLQAPRYRQGAAFLLSRPGWWSR